MNGVPKKTGTKKKPKFAEGPKLDGKLVWQTMVSLGVTEDLFPSQFGRIKVGEIISGVGKLYILVVCMYTKIKE